MEVSVVIPLMFGVFATAVMLVVFILVVRVKKRQQS